MIVYQCDTPGCAATSRPRVLATLVDETNSGRTMVRRNRPTLPRGWVEVRTYAGFDKAIPVGGEIVNVAPDSVFDLTISSIETFQCDEMQVVLEGDLASVADKLRATTIQVGRMHLIERGEVAIAPLPDEARYGVLFSWLTTHVQIRNPTLLRGRAQLVATGIPLTVGGVLIEPQSRFLCPDHAPRLRDDGARTFDPKHDGEILR